MHFYCLFTPTLEQSPTFGALFKNGSALALVSAILCVPRLWRFALSTDKKQKGFYTTTSQTKPEANNVYDLTRMEALVRYMHVAAGFPVRYTWNKAI